MKDTSFYNAESTAYSAKRYPARAMTFTQYFFKERLARVNGVVQTYARTRGTPARLLEIGCADGVVVRALWQKMPHAFSAIDAVDLSPDMVATAAQNNADTPIRFMVRENASLTPPYDVVLEVGVLNYTDLEADLRDAARLLDAHGIYLCSVAGASSLQNKIKGSSGYKHLLGYAQYEQELRRYFTIRHAVPVGIFVPLLWRLPALARIVQPWVEWAGRISPNWALEKIYVLERR